MKIGEEVRKNVENLCVNTVILKGGKMDKKMNSHEMQGKIEKFLNLVLKRDPHCAKHAIFVIEMSHEQVAKNP